MRKATPAGAPYLPTEWVPADAAAMRRLAAGEASAEDQRRALDWLMKCCGTYDLSFRPTGDRDTVFAEGKRFVGLQIVKLLNVRSQSREQA